MPDFTLGLGPMSKSKTLSPAAMADLRKGLIHTMKRSGPGVYPEAFDPETGQARDSADITDQEVFDGLSRVLYAPVREAIKAQRARDREAATPTPTPDEDVDGEMT